MVRVLGILALGVTAVAGQGTQPKAKAADYPAHAVAGTLEIGAENWGHGFTTTAGGMATGEFLAIEVALFNKDIAPISVQNGHFTLRLNKGTPIIALPPSYVSTMMKYPEWQDRPTLTATASAGDGQVTMGRPPQPERFPGDPRARGGNGPVPRAPDPQDPEGMKRDQSPTLEAVVAKCALVEGTPSLPMSGYLFFPYRGKMSKLKTIELIYDGPAGSASLELR